MRRKTTEQWVTTVIPTFERAKLLERAVRSVLAQTYPYAKVAVFDNASGDDTAEVMNRLAQEAPGRVEYTRNPTNLGSLDNFNLAIKSVQTPFFTVMSDDDVLLPRFVEDALQALDENPGAEIASGFTWVVSEDGIVAQADPTRFPMGYSPAPAASIAMLDFRHPDWQGMLFSRAVLERSGGLNPNVSAFDVEFVIRAAAKHGVVFYPKHAALFMRHTSSSTFDLPLKYIYPSLLNTLESLQSDPEVPQSVKDHAAIVIPRRLESALRRYLLTEMVSSAPRDMEIAAQALLELNADTRNLRIARLSRIVSRNSIARHLGHRALQFRRARLRPSPTANLDLPDFSAYLRLPA